MRRLAFLLLAPAAAGCAPHAVGPEAAVPAAPSWRETVREEDRTRLKNWRKAWVEALAKARAAGEAGVAAQGALVDPDAALDNAALPPGDYRCRAVKLGSQAAGVADLVAYPAVPCRVGGEMTFETLGGPQRPTGRLFEDVNRRVVFLGTLQLGDEQGVMRYGHDAQRDMAGFVERIGERRWRLVLPYPHFESTLDVVEIVPVS